MDSGLIERILQKAKTIDPSLEEQLLDDISDSLDNTGKLVGYLERMQDRFGEEFDAALEELDRHV